MNNNYNVEVRRSNRRTISIEVTPQSKVIVRAPYAATMFRINNFLEDKRLWIEKCINKYSEMQDKMKDVEKISNAELKALADKALIVIPQKVRYYAGIIGVEYGRIIIRNQKTRWGSCSSKHNLNFNCLLMLTTDEVIDYVVVHELCHIKEMNHGPEFWREVEMVLPDYRERKKWLREHEAEIQMRVSG